MARLRAILRALAAVMRRERKSFGSIASNNFFVATALLLQQAGVFLFLIGALVVLFPMSADPLQKIPPERMALWPLEKKDRMVLRLLSPWLNPITWLLLALAGWSIWHVESFSLFLLAAGLFAIGFALPNFSGGWRMDAVLRRIPPIGGQLVRKNLRELFSTLDFYIALLLSVAGMGYRLFIRELPGDAMMIMTLLIVLALSSYAQCLFGLESAGGIARYHLLPLPGWRVLAAKDIAFLIVVLLLTAPLSPATGLAAALAALAVGHAPSVAELRPQMRWRFTSGAGFSNGALQVIAMSGAGVTAYRINVLILIPAIAACAGSTWWFGRKLEGFADRD